MLYCVRRSLVCVPKLLFWSKVERVLVEPRGGLVGAHVASVYCWLQHGLWLYVNDGMLLLPKSVAPLVGGVTVLFLCALGAPLSWRKLDLGTELV